MVESQPSKLLVAGSIPVSRSNDFEFEDVSKTMYEQATIAVADQGSFGTVKQAIDSAFSDSNVSGFLSSLERAKLRIRHFEEIARAGKLGPQAEAAYAALGDGDQGMIREHYLSTLEKVDPELRRKFLKVYAYY